MLTDLRLRIPRNFYFCFEEGEDGGEGGSGGSGSGSGDDGSGAAGDQGGEGGGKGSKMLSQDEVNRKIQREKRDAKAAGKRELLESLGLNPDDFKPEDVKGILEKVASDEAAALGATEAARREAETTKQTAARLAQEAAQDRLAAKVERKLIKATGFDPDDTDDARRLQRLYNTVAADLAVDADGDAIDEAIGEIRKDFPTLFGGDDSGSGSGTPPPSDRGGASRQHRQGGGGKSPMELGAERAKAAAGNGDFVGSDGNYSFLSQ